MRADRLIAVLLLLQRRGKVTVAEVAAELEISERTARRDLEALAMSGVPVYSQRGRGGGWQLIGGATTDLTGLSSDEARALFLAVGPTAEQTPALTAALGKLGAALPETFRADAEAASLAVKVDAAGWSTIHTADTPPLLGTLTDAVIERRQIELAYESPRSGASERTAHPLGLVTKRGVWYLVADTDPSRHPEGLRTFRLDRIRSVEVLDEPAERADGFDLDAAWANIVSDVRAMGAGHRATVVVAPELARPLQWVFSGRHTLGETRPDGRVEVTVWDTSLPGLAAQIAGFGAGLELVDDEPAIRAELARIAEELSEMYSG